MWCIVKDVSPKHGISIHQYADDIQLYLAFDMDKQIAKVEACLSDIRIWMRQNKLKLNEGKTELIITFARLVHKVTISSIRIDDCEVAASQTAKNLGASATYQFIPT